MFELLKKLEEAESLLNNWLVDNTEQVFEEEGEIDEARMLVNEAIDELRLHLPQDKGPAKKAVTPCEDHSCSDYRTHNGGCSVCGDPCF